MSSKPINFKKLLFQNSTAGFVALGLVIVAGLGIVIPTGIMLKNRVVTLATTSLESAIVTGCKSRRVHRSSRSRTSRRRTSYAPVALTENGARAVGLLTLGRKNQCESMIGVKTSVFVHPSDEKKNRIGSFFQFWFFPYAVAFALAMLLMRVSTQTRITIGLAFAAFAALALGREFDVFDVRTDSSNKLLTAEGKFDSCIQRHMNNQGVAHLADLRKLACHPMVDLSILHDFRSLEELTITRSTLSSISDLPHLSSLKKLRLGANKNLTSLEGIERFSDLEKLDLWSNGITDIGAVAKLKKLTSFKTMREPFTDISALGNLKHLRTARFSGTLVKDFSALHGLPKLYHTGATGRQVPCEQITALRNSFKRKVSMWLPKHCRN